MNSQIYTKIRKSFDFSQKENKWASKLVSRNGNFYIHIVPNNYTFFRIIPEFKVRLNNKINTNLMVLKKFKQLLKCGVIYKKHNLYTYSVSDLNDLFSNIIPFFARKFLKNKRPEFTFFSKIVKLMVKGSHLTSLGLTKIIDMKLDYEALSIFKYESTDDTDDEELFNKIDDFTNSHINYY